MAIGGHSSFTGISSLRKSPEAALAMARKPQKLPDYFTSEETSALVVAGPSYPVRMVMRIMLRTGFRVSECLSLRPADLRLNREPPILSLRPDVLGNKAKRGREAPVPADLVESLADLKSFHRRERNRPCFDISRQWVSKSMEEEAVAAGIDPARD
jgi:integrase